MARQYEIQIPHGHFKSSAKIDPALQILPEMKSLLISRRELVYSFQGAIKRLNFFLGQDRAMSIGRNGKYTVKPTYGIRVDDL